MVVTEKLFGVPDEILDVTRSSGRVRRQRLIYRKSCFGHRKSFGLIGSVSGLPVVYWETIGRGISTQEATWAVGGLIPALRGLVRVPHKAHAAGKNYQRENKAKRWK